MYSLSEFVHSLSCIEGDDYANRSRICICIGYLYLYWSLGFRLRLASARDSFVP